MARGRAPCACGTPVRGRQTDIVTFALLAVILVSLVVALGVNKSWMAFWAAFAGSLWWLASAVASAFPPSQSYRDCSHAHPDCAPGYRVVCAIIPSIVLTIFAIAYLGYANLAGAAPMGITIYRSPCGASACTSAYQLVWPFNPNGFLSYLGPTTVQEIHAALQSMGYMRCPTIGCKWASVAGLPVQGYAAAADTSCTPDLAAPCPTSAPTPSCGNYATANRADYPDLGRGLSGGYGPGLCITAGDPVPCAGLTIENAYVGAFQGVGPYVCAQCLPYWLDAGLVPAAIHDDWTASCPSSLYDDVSQVGCNTCPGAFWGESYDAQTLERATIIMIVCLAAADLVELVRFLIDVGRACRGAQPRAKPW